MSNQDLKPFFIEKIKEAKNQFERTIDCKHTEFDTLYPYMSEQPQFFWYKRYVAWQELLTTVKLSEELEVAWETVFSKKQTAYVKDKVLDAKVLDDWYEENEIENKEENPSINEH
ncbi:hypothetical protein BKP35_10120 [Anaerobacillus arseniciselenatis]|uniref:Uncharacterized protein n=1 Tax=Anaerobacillus arseniciselenatis TaxID=85682 RepID=A0A1S2LL24_9BACI|nr:hypothetical protein [Anaerobacillus arseniciselenatis]OIJ12910.1 hypothetical protein BKP35_10120 [Anaerobacillus arseniciselenatis]